VASGKYPLSNFPIIPVTDGAGEVAAVGSDVTAWSPGTRVIPHFIPNWQDGRMPAFGGGPRRGIDLPGGLAEYVVVPAHSLVRTPEHLSDAEAATLPIAATTAWRAVRTAALGPHKIALLLGTGGVSLFALQFAKAHGARVIITSSSDEKLERARRLGADEIINYKSTPKWANEVLRLTDGKGVDLVLETGGASTFPQSIQSAALEGTIFIIGFLSGMEPTIHVGPVMEKRLRLQGNNTGPVADLADAAAALASQRLQPVIDRTFPMDQAAAAYEHVARGGHFGKGRDKRSLKVPAIGVPPGSSRAADVIFLSPEGYANNSDSETVNRGFFDRHVANQLQIPSYSPLLSAVTQTVAGAR
jgi:NADPH:quinone reductase-like Zn-dependent oxidoreductase